MDFNALIARIQRLLLSPNTEWDAIAAEPYDMQKIYMNYAGPLIIAAALAAAIGMSVIGISLPFAGTFHQPVGAALAFAITQIVAGLIGVYFLAFVINALAPQFGGTQDMGQAFKLAAYSPTAAWVAGILNILPQLGLIAALASLYSFYLLYTGIPKLMKPEHEKAMAYTVAVCLVTIVVSFVIGLVASSALPSLTPGMRLN